ncbi:MAG: hypothetical protein NDJ89_04775 [Oligoflexia bacterium]|nr:hypothetical protein [Oligoflexia bacterium]
MRRGLFVSALLPLLMTAGLAAATAAARTDPGSLTYVSATTATDASWETATPWNALSYAGPLGPFGPLGTLGPLGGFGPRGDWRRGVALPASCGHWCDSIRNSQEGPFSSHGPLGVDGPLGDSYFDGALFAGNAPATELRGLGRWAALGPLGPLGALGPLGPLGPLGIGELLETDAHGNYRDRNGRLVRELRVPYSARRTRRYELVEVHTESTLRANPATDASFLVIGEISQGERGEDRYAFRSVEEQLVTLALVPEKSLDDFDLLVLDERGNPIAASDHAGMERIEWIQLRAPAGARLQALVRLRGSAQFLSHSYRLVVTPSTAALNATPNSGTHVRPWYR